MQVLKRIFPILNDLSTYNSKLFKGDLIAGLTVGVLLIPQGMAYAMLAGLPPIYGLYASLLPLLVYALLGTSRQLSVGPIATDSIFIATSVSILAEIGSDRYIELVILLALMVGFLQFLFGVLRLGFLVNFLSRPVIFGFTAAIAVIIALSQLKHLFGLDINSNGRAHEVLIRIAQNLDEFHLTTFIIGISSIGFILLMKMISRKIPYTLLLVVFGILFIYLGEFDQQGVSVVGTVPPGLPAFSVPSFNQDNLSILIPAALSLSLIAFMEAISVGKAIESKHDYYKIKPNRELIALGMSNMIGSFFSSFSVTGGFSRSAVNNDAGAKTGVSSLISVVLIAITLLWLTDLFYYLPKVILAAIIIMAVIKLVNLKIPRELWRTDKKEFLMYSVTLLGTLFIGIQEGLAIGVVLSLILLIYKVTNPHMAIVGKFPGTNLYRNVERFEDVDVDPEILIVRFDARLFYANTNYFCDKITEFEKTKDERLKAIIIDASGINSIDSTAINCIKELTKSYKKKGITLLFSGLKGPVRDSFQKHAVFGEHGEAYFFVNIENAEKYLKGEDFNSDNIVARQSNV